MRAIALCNRLMSCKRLGRPVSGSRRSCCSFVRHDAMCVRLAARTKLPWIPPSARGGHRLGVLVDRLRGEDAHDAVMEDDVADREQERDPVLVQGQEPDHHEEVGASMTPPQRWTRSAEQVMRPVHAETMRQRSGTRWAIASALSPKSGPTSTSM